MEKATFAAGCFWGVEATFRQMPGVISTRVGYTGGKTENPTYKEVCTDRTGHAEAVEVEFDPAKLTYCQAAESVLREPRSHAAEPPGPGLGYAVPHRDLFSFARAENAGGAVQSKNWRRPVAYSKPIATQIVPAVTFYPAEDYHQQYLEKRGLASCHIRT